MRVRSASMPERTREQQLLIAVRRVELGDVEPVAAGARTLAGQSAPTRRLGEVALAEALDVDAVVDAR